MRRGRASTTGELLGSPASDARPVEFAGRWTSDGRPVYRLVCDRLGCSRSQRVWEVAPGCNKIKCLSNECKAAKRAPHNIPAEVMRQAEAAKQPEQVHKTNWDDP